MWCKYVSPSLYLSHSLSLSLSSSSSSSLSLSLSLSGWWVLLSRGRRLLPRGRLRPQEGRRLLRVDARGGVLPPQSAITGGRGQDEGRPLLLLLRSGASRERRTATGRNFLSLHNKRVSWKVHQCELQAALLVQCMLHAKLPCVENLRSYPTSLISFLYPVPHSVSSWYCIANDHALLCSTCVGEKLRMGTTSSYRPGFRLA